jgi:ketosteroid isomerase-like protein
VSSNDARATTLVRALRAGVEGDRDVLEALLTDDVRAWTPARCTGSLGELVDELNRGDDAFSEVELVVTPLDVGGDYACVEWSVALTHTGPLAVDAGRSIDATGLRVAVHGVTVAEFRGPRICSLRQYWDESSVLDQLGVPVH